MGRGPLTGRGMGPCCYGGGFGMGYGRRFVSRREEKEILEEEASYLKEELQAIKERISDLEKGE